MRISRVLLCIIALWSLLDSVAYACDLCGSTNPRPPRDSYTSYMMCAHPPSTICNSCPPKPNMMCESCSSNAPQPISISVKPVIAAASDYEEPHMEGLYVGINGGYSIGDVKTGITNSFIPSISSGGHLGTRGVIYGLYAGYQKQFSDIGVIGFELGGGRDGIKGSFTDPPITVTFKGSSSYSAAIRAGLIMNYWLVSIKLGIEETKIKGSVTDSINPSGNLILGSSKRKRGNLFGIGFETMVSDNMMFGGEWTITTYKSISGTSQNGVVYSLKPKLSAFKIRLGYLF